MIGVNTNISLLYTNNISRLNQKAFSQSVDRLSSGLKINSAADDPSGLAISKDISSQLHGTDTAIGNTQDTITMLNLADSFLDDAWGCLNQMRELCLRLANVATLSNNPAALFTDEPNPSDCKSLYEDIGSLKDHIYNSFTLRDSDGNDLNYATLNYNHKNFFWGPATGFAAGEAAQIGADNSDSQRMQIVIPEMVDYFSDFEIPQTPAPGNATLNYYRTYADTMIDTVNDKMDIITNSRETLATQVERLNHVVNDLNVTYIQNSGMKSGITDADMAEEITSMTKNQIIQQTANITFTQANAQPLMVTKLIGAIYNGVESQTML
jgi:flagellin